MNEQQAYKVHVFIAPPMVGVGKWNSWTWQSKWAHIHIKKTVDGFFSSLSFFSLINLISHI